MYRNLSRKLQENNISHGDISKLLGIHRNSVINKIHGHTPMFLDEAAIIYHTYFSNEDFWELFKKEQGV